MESNNKENIRIKGNNRVWKEKKLINDIKE
jgi:hypothetical protein